MSYNWLFLWGYTLYFYGVISVLITGITRAINVDILLANDIPMIFPFIYHGFLWVSMGFLWATSMSSATSATMHPPDKPPPGRGCHQVFPAILVLEAEATKLVNIIPISLDRFMVDIPNYLMGVIKQRSHQWGGTTLQRSIYGNLNMRWTIYG